MQAVGVSRPRVLVLVGAVGLLLAGCAGPAVSSPSAGSTVTITEGTRTATRSVVTTVTQTARTAAQPPPPTDEPAPVVADCPYLDDEVVADINGQHTGATTVIDVRPYPICVFRRTDGEWLATVRIVQADSPEAAVAAVNQHVPIDGSSPVDNPPGWTGGAMPTDQGSIYAVSKGPISVIAEANQPQSVKGRQLAVAAIANLGL